MVNTLPTAFATLTARRLVLMQYGVTLSSVEGHTTHFLDDVVIAGSHDAIVAILAQDAGLRTPGYAGWALFSSSDLTACP